MYTKTDYINAIQWHFGMTKTAAEKHYKENLMAGNLRYLDLLVEGFKGNARKNFYTD